MSESDYNEIRVENMTVRVFPEKIAMGHAAADLVEDRLQSVIDEKDEANIIIATGASQFTFYEALRKKNDIPWNKVRIFHLDEYVGMSDQHPASFRKYLRERILQYIEPKEVHLLEGDTKNLEAESEQYEQLLKQVTIDLACIGIGENGHIAFNDPPVADFNDSRLVKVVELDKDCRKQQLGEGWFSSLEEVPTHALSLTIPGIMRSESISCVVPDARKSNAVFEALNGPISEKCPASVLRTHQDCTLFLDKHSAEKL